MLIHFAAMYLALLPFAQCIQIERHMSKEEVWKTFQTGHDNVPDYQIVRLYHTLHKRDINDNSTQMVKYNVVGRTISLYLEPTEGILAGVSTPVWTVAEDAGEPGKLKHTLQPNLLANIGRAYQDVSKMAAVVAYEGEDGETLVHGNLPEDSVIRPLPHHLHNTVLRESRDLEDFLPDGVDGEADFRRSHPHVVFKRREADLNANHDDIRVVKRERRSSGATVNDTSETSIPDIIYPEMLIIVDSVIYEAIGKKLEEVTRYVLAFWNAVDLRYRLLEKPMIRLNIAVRSFNKQPCRKQTVAFTVVCSVDNQRSDFTPEMRQKNVARAVASPVVNVEPGGTPYLTLDSGSVYVHIALINISSYLYAESYRFPLESYDIGMVMTGLNLHGIRPDGSKRMIHGVGNFRCACDRNDTAMSTRSLGIINDNGGYKGIKTTVHELAHLLGALHDGGPITEDCPTTDSYLMTTSRRWISNDLQFSNCSLRDIYDFLSSPVSTCLRNKPRADQALPRLLPGQLLTLDEQCEKITGRKACHHDARVCTALTCKSKYPKLCKRLAAAAEGSSCGNEMHCINSFCVSKMMVNVPYEPSTTRNPLQLPCP